MVSERLAWAGGVLMFCIGIYIVYVPIAIDLGKVLVAALAGLVILACSGMTLPLAAGPVTAVYHRYG